MHFHAGTIPIAFVFSAPGSKEKISGKPVTGVTGENLEFALKHLTIARPDLFSSSRRYDYRITNAYALALAKALGDKRSEAEPKQILEPANIERVIRELWGMKLVILCGVKAAHLKASLSTAGFRVIVCSHTSNQGLTVHNAAARAGVTPYSRRQLRVLAWATSLLNQLE
ncbi:uracil-DNA glycosylase family protein [Polaromonas sp. SP1]|uniref:uracil-DNA glycosylase family protein n=1 Tax=unclassified Polaromonas TaxID=2638319 RepID=UPI000F08449A|nr:hypothetical protein DT070_21140 [Polaromonas sp. SP1]